MPRAKAEERSSSRKKLVALRQEIDDEFIPQGHEYARTLTTAIFPNRRDEGRFVSMTSYVRVAIPPVEKRWMTKRKNREDEKRA